MSHEFCGISYNKLLLRSRCSTCIDHGSYVTSHLNVPSRNSAHRRRNQFALPFEDGADIRMQLGTGHIHAFRFQHNRKSTFLPGVLGFSARLICGPATASRVERRMNLQTTNRDGCSKMPSTSGGPTLFYRPAYSGFVTKMPPTENLKLTVDREPAI